MVKSPLLEHFKPFAEVPGSILLESNQGHTLYGRYSVMAANPFLVLMAEGENITILTADGSQSFKSPPLEVLEECLNQYQSPSLPYGPGALGYLSYELGYEFQQIPVFPIDDLFFPRLWFAFYDETLVYDHFENRLETISIPPQKKIPLDLLDEKRKVHQHGAMTHFTFGDYKVAFDVAMENIKAGNIYQVNLCQRFSTETLENPWRLYLQLRNAHPTSYCAYLNTGHGMILSASPELFLQKRSENIKTRPIKGTIRKETEPALQPENWEKLRASVKDQAEHIMIVDLERNDLGRICEFGSIAPTPLFEVETCGQVNHLVSTIQGKLKKSIGIGEILKATFPGGSVTGAPKRKAMEIIGSIEPVMRGLYTGALGWIGFSKDFTFNLPIRTVVIQEKRAHIYLGSGIVSDSKVDQEYQEILQKGAPFFKLFGVSAHEPSLA